MISVSLFNSVRLDQLRPQDLLPHRPPMLLIDQLIEYVPGHSVVAETTVRPDTIFLEGHFPGEPILPGIVLVEMMFQACGIYGRLEAINALEGSNQGAAAYQPQSGRAVKIDQLTFSKAVLPGDQLLITAVFSHKLLNFSVFNAQVEIKGRGMAAAGKVTVLINP